MQETIISFKDYSYQYRSQALPTIMDVNLDIQKGERIIIVGPSGCGKSTLAHCLNGLNPFSYPGESTGSLMICGTEAVKASIFELSRYVGTVLQDTDGQFIGMTVMEDIAFSMENDCIPQNELIERTGQEAAKVFLSEKLDAAPHELSGGQKQRVSMAGIMVNQVPVLLFDEPLANLDPAAGKAAIELIDKLQKNQDKTVIIIEHRLEDAMHMGADRIILMADGRVVSDTSPEDLFLSGRLVQQGIREPLYLTALKYAGIQLSKDMHVGRIQELTLCKEHKEQVRKWFADRPNMENSGEKKEALRAEGIHFGYLPEKENLSDISFSINVGEMISIVGKNGAGKSTMAKLLCGFERPGRGKLYAGGRDTSEDTIKERAANIGYVMQNPNQMICKPMVFDEVSMSLTLQNLPDEVIKERVNDTLRICGLYQFRNWPVNALSYGQKKRVTIASILVSRPGILILDEPTAGQDFRHYTDIMEFLRELNQQGITVLMITHDMHLMLEYTDRSLVFADGRLIADTTPQAMFSDPSLLKKASLKETSLYSLAGSCGIEPEAYIRAFINYDREARAI